MSANQIQFKSLQIVICNTDRLWPMLIIAMVVVVIIIIIKIWQDYPSVTNKLNRLNVWEEMRKCIDVYKAKRFRNSASHQHHGALAGLALVKEIFIQEGINTISLRGPLLRPLFKHWQFDWLVTVSFTWQPVIFYPATLSSQSRKRELWKKSLPGGVSANSALRSPAE